MRIAFVIPSLANKGPVIMVKELTTYLVKHGHHCDVYYFDEIIELDFPCSTFRISFFRTFNYNSYEVIHSHLFRPDLYCAINKWRLSKSVKLLSTLHTSIYEDLKYTHGTLKSQLIIPLWVNALKYMDAVVVLTEAARKYYKKTHLKRSIIINNGRDIPSCSDPVAKDDETVIIEMKKKYTLLGSVCLLDKRKGLEQVLQLLTIQKNYAYIVVGDGAERTFLEEMASTYGVSDRFLALGARLHGYRYLPHFDVFLIPSRSEGLPLALLEAMAMKVPVVCSEIPVFTEEFNLRQFSFFELDNIQSLSFACVEALRNADKLIGEAFKQYQQRFTVEKMGENYIELYKSL